MPLTATCPSCSQKCQVEDQFAGKQVRCPKCGNTMTMPLSDVPTAHAAPEPPLAAAEPLPGAPGAGFVDTIKQSLAAFRIDALTTKLLYAGAGCLAAMVVFTFLPWVSIGNIGVGQFQMHVGVTRLGIQVPDGSGVLNFLLSLAALAFIVVTIVVIKKRDVFDISLWVAGGWGALASLWRIINVANFGSAAGIGLYLTLLASLGAAGTFGYIIFQRFMQKKV